MSELPEPHAEADQVGGRPDAEDAGFVVDQVYSSEEEELVAERLEALGYLD